MFQNTNSVKPNNLSLKYQILHHRVLKILGIKLNFDFVPKTQFLSAFHRHLKLPILPLLNLKPCDFGGGCIRLCCTGPFEVQDAGPALPKPF